MQSPKYLPVIKSDYAENLDWEWLSLNPSPKVYYLLNKLKTPNKIFSYELSSKMLEEMLEKCPKYIDWKVLSLNPKIFHLLKNLLKNHEHKIINWFELSKNPNPNAIPLIEEHFNMYGTYTSELSANPNAVPFLKENPSIIDWKYLARNPNANAIPIMEEMLKECYPKKVKWIEWDDFWDELSFNPNAISLLEKYPRKIRWYFLSANPNAIHLLEKNLDKIDWCHLSENPNAIHLLEKNLDKIDWSHLSCNPNAISLLKENQDKINWRMLSCNPNIMELVCDLDYDAMKQSMQPLAEELTAYVFHPLRMNRIAEQYNISFDDLISDIY